MKKLLLIAILSLVAQVQTNASLTVDELSSETYLKNNGYSTQTAEVVNVVKARSLGDEYYTKDEQAFKNQNKFVRFWRKLYVYADPAAEDYSIYHHETDTTPSYTDL